MLELPVVELTEVYRQALKSPILRFALAVDDGEYKQPNFSPVSTLNPTTQRKEFAVSNWNESVDAGILVVHPWQKPISADHALYDCS